MGYMTFKSLYRARTLINKNINFKPKNPKTNNFSYIEIANYILIRLCKIKHMINIDTYHKQ